MSILSAHCLARRWWVIGGFTLAVAAAAPGLGRLTIDNSPEKFFVRDADALDRYRDLELAFGRDRGVRVVVSGPGLWTADGLTWLAELEERLASVHGVAGAGGPFRHHGWRFQAWPPADVVGFAADVASNSVDRNAGWVSHDGGTVTILVGLFRLERAERDAVLARIERLVSAAPSGVEAQVAGLAVVNRALDEALVRMAKRFFPVLLAVAVMLLGAAYRRPADVLLPLVVVGISEAVVFGAMGWAGQDLDVVVIVLVPLLFVIAVATAVHVLTYFRRTLATLPPGEEARPNEEAVVTTYRVKGWPVLWTGLTTAAGFGSLSVSAVPPVRALGLWSAFGISFMTLAMLSLYPALLAGLRAGRATRSPRTHLARARPEARWEESTEAIARRSIRSRRGVITVFVAAALAASAGLPRLGIETAVLTYFRPQAPIRARIEALERHGLGVVAASLVISRQAGPRFDDPGGLVALAELAEVLRRETVGVSLGVLSAGDLVADAGRPREGAAAMSRGLERIASHAELERMLGYLLSDDGHTTRVTMLLPLSGQLGAVGYRELEPVFARAVSLADRRFPQAEVWITGQYPLVLAAQRSLLRTMLVSLSATVACIAAVFTLLLRSGSLTLRALAVNLWPVLFVLGLMGWGGVPVDSSTVMIASVVLGLAVDDTLHSLGSFRKLGPSLGSAEGAAVTLRETGGAHVVSSALLITGFATVALSALVPVSRFGWIAACGLAAALVADLSLAPALLAGATPRSVGRLRERR